MITDAHCHVWEKWPYTPAVPDPTSRASIEQLLFEMDSNGVDNAVIICARIGDNPRNVDYAVDAAARYPGRLVVFPDLECKWSADFRAAGAVDRLQTSLERWDFVGFTMYLDESEDGSWLTSAEGLAFSQASRPCRTRRRLWPALPRHFPACRYFCITLHSWDRAVPRRPTLWTW